MIFMAILCGYQGGRIALSGWLYGRADAARLARARPCSRSPSSRASSSSRSSFPGTTRPRCTTRRCYAARRSRRPIPGRPGPRRREPRRSPSSSLASCARSAPPLASSRSRRRRARGLASSTATRASVGRRKRARAAPSPVKVGIVQGNMPLIGAHTSARRAAQRLTEELKRPGRRAGRLERGARSAADRETADEDDVRRARLTRRSACRPSSAPSSPARSRTRAG